MGGKNSDKHRIKSWSGWFGGAKTWIWNCVSEVKIAQIILKLQALFSRYKFQVKQ